MSYQKVQELALKYADRLDRNQEFHEQRLKMWHFYVLFYSELRALIGDMEGNIRVLKEKGFDHKMLKLYISAYRGLLQIMKSTNKEKPYETVQEFIQYVLGRPHGILLDNLDFLIQHHLKANQVDTKTGPMLGQVQFDTIASLKELALRTKKFIESNPTIPIPGMGKSTPPVSMDTPPAYTPAAPEEATNPGIPSAKKKLAI